MNLNVDNTDLSVLFILTYFILKPLCRFVSLFPYSEFRSQHAHNTHILRETKSCYYFITQNLEFASTANQRSLTTSDRSKYRVWAYFMRYLFYLQY